MIKRPLKKIIHKENTTNIYAVLNSLCIPIQLYLLKYNEPINTKSKKKKNHFIIQTPEQPNIKFLEKLIQNEKEDIIKFKQWIRKEIINYDNKKHYQSYDPYPTSNYPFNKWLITNKKTNKINFQHKEIFFMKKT